MNEEREINDQSNESDEQFLARLNRESVSDYLPVVSMQQARLLLCIANSLQRIEGMLESIQNTGQDFWEKEFNR